MQTDKFGGQVREPAERAFHTPGLEGDVLPLDVAQLAQALMERLAKHRIGDKLTDAGHRGRRAAPR